MVSAAQASANVRTATLNEARRLGFYTNDGSGFAINSLAPSQQIALTNAVAAYILAHRDLFDTGATDLTNPWLSATKGTNTQTEATGGGLGDYLGALSDNLATAGNAAAGIGQGVLNVAYMSRWLIPGAVLLFVGLWIINHTGRPPAASE